MVRRRLKTLLPIVPLALLSAAWILASIWLQGQLEQKDWVPIVLSGLGLLVALLTAVWSSFEQRRLLTLNFAVTLWEKWSEPGMLATRNTAWEALRTEPILQGRKRVGRLRTAAPDTYLAIARLNHFLADLNDLVEAGLLNVREVSALFRDTLQAYYCHLHFVDVRDAFADGTGESQQRWFEQKVLGLAQRLKLRTADDFQRYADTFRANEAASRARNPVR